MAALQQGVVVLRYKQRKRPILVLPSLVLPVLLFIASILIFLFGVSTQGWLFVIFAVIAGRTSIRQFMFWRKSSSHSRDWWFFHIENMFTCCIATITAFAVTAVPRLFPSLDLDSIWVWLAPTFIMVPWMLWFIRKYEKQFGLKK